MNGKINLKKEHLSKLIKKSILLNGTWYELYLVQEQHCRPEKDY